MTALVFLLLIACLAASIPIFMSLAIVAFIIFFFYTSIPLEILPQRMFAGVEGFALLAVPFFILAANIMGKGGVTARLIRFANTLVGHFPGGLAICAVLTCLFFGAITGSSASTVVAIGGIMYPALLEAGYSSRFSLGVVTCSALLGMIIPPSNAMIIYGSVSKVSVGALFMSGFGAGIVFAIIYAIYCYFYAKKHKIPLRAKASWRETARTCREAIWGLGMPLIILGGIYSGVFTPTESAAVAVAYSMFVARFVYRELTFKGIWMIGLESAMVTARVLIMVSAATLFSWLLTVQGITQQLVRPVADLHPPYWAVLAFSNVSMLLAGMFIDVFSNILIICPLLLPLVTGAGISELHFGIVAAVNSDMGNITPPFGLNIFVASGTFNKSYLEAVRAVLPWLLLAILSLMIITYIPGISLWLPKMLYPGIK
ncbi:MAG: TRAP transporter large permease [Deltaproteobacteria bacterium]|nr:TRAP transporter large permease [Deltaproteobacteria bacterium]MBW2308760.1 TRAP transporter large permease [Deltaproteobacteria bacterium]